jgi:hypothetical protein
MGVSVFLRTPGQMAAFFALGLTSFVRAESPATPPAEPATLPALALSKRAAAADAGNPRTPVKHERLVSSEVAAAVASSLPKYQPPPKPTERTASDLRETDKPKNDIIRLEKFIVREPKPPVFTERQLSTRKGLADLAMKRQPGLKIGNFGGMNEGPALLMYAEQERLKNIADLNKDARDAKNSGDSSASDHILRENNRANYRPSDFGWNSDDPAGKK